MKNPIARSMTIGLYNQYKLIRRSGLEGKSLANKTLNNHLGYLRAMYNSLIRSKDIKYRNPLEEAEMIRVQQSELGYLTHHQIKLLLNDIDTRCRNLHIKLIVRLCLSTGARWGEVESRKLYHFKDNRVEYSNTKGKRTRTIPVEPELFNQVCTHLEQHKTFSSSIGAFRRALKRTGIELPKGQASHVLRHSFASHFMMNGGNIIVLQKVLGHASITMTMRYAKFDLSHLKEAKQLNPLSNLNSERPLHEADSKPETKPFGHFVDTLFKEFLESKKKALQINDLQGFQVVEAGGIEPPSVDSLPSALHA